MGPLLKEHKHVISAEADRLGQLGALETLEVALQQVPTPACLAVYGPWGSGKTTLLHSAHVRRGQGPSVWFDPWPYERSQDVVGPLIHAVAEGPAVGESVRTVLLGHAVALVKLIALVGLRAGVVSAVGGEVGRALSGLDVAKEYKALRAKGEAGDPVKAVRARFQALVEAALAGQGEGARLVVFLDDLDRCLPDSVVELIEAVKLLLCGLPETRAVFVFALDRQVVGEAIRQRYPGSDGYTGENYLEKIFDLALEVPPVVHRDLKQFIVHQLHGGAGPAASVDALTRPFASSGQPDGLLQVVEVLSEPMFANPRVISRVLNRLALLLASAARREAIEAVDDAVRLRRWLLWIAGAERFRGFRYAVQRASVAEIQSFQALLEGKAEGLSAEGQRLARQPGFGRYLEALFGRIALRTELSPTAGLELVTVADFDHLLRSAGL